MTLILSHIYEAENIKQMIFSWLFRIDWPDPCWEISVSKLTILFWQDGKLYFDQMINCLFLANLQTKSHFVQQSIGSRNSYMRVTKEEIFHYPLSDTEVKPDLVLTSGSYYETSWWRQIALRSWIEVLIVCNGNSASHTFDGQVDHSWCEISQAPKFAGILKNMDLYIYIYVHLIHSYLTHLGQDLFWDALSTTFFATWLRRSWCWQIIKLIPKVVTADYDGSNNQ